MSRTAAVRTDVLGDDGFRMGFKACLNVMPPLILDREGKKTSSKKLTIFHGQSVRLMLYRLIHMRELEPYPQ